VPTGNITLLVRSDIIYGNEATMTVIHPDRYINEIARRMPELTGRDEIEEALDRLEYIYEVIAPEMQDNVETLIRMLRVKLKDIR
jgi:hypothetical protein